MTVRLSRRRGALAALGALALSTALLAGCTSAPAPSASGSGSGAPTGSGSTSGSSSSPARPSSTAPSTTAPVGKPVHVSVNVNDGQQIGVGLPIIATFPVKITDGRAFQKATTVTVNDQTVPAAWYFEYSDPASGHVMEAHLRLENYWPAHSTVHVNMPWKGLSAGTGLYFENSLTLDFTTGVARVVKVSNASHRLTVYADGAVWGAFPVSLGASNTPTARGIKVIMEKGLDIRMRGPGYDDPHVKYTQRLTYGGEYLHSAPWNTYNIDHGINSSNGCTNLHPADATKLYSYLQVGDPVEYPDANGPAMTLGAGYGDWNVSWAAWQTGGAIHTQ